ncbi:NACHT domain-containing protein [Kibdelosporangium aridum]|uniref:NACHT domain-containing protein n=1 Tax=Kibdelosporangium aridum TaxID=2030 RepID=UPI00135CD0D5|nr:NACHT domain-containing protein [Kibdelosporangium aridum]
MTRDDSASFDKHVGWANILALTIGAVGVILILVDKVERSSDLSSSRIDDLAGTVAKEALRQDSLLLAHLLSTDSLDSRAARGNFVKVRPRTSKGRPTKRVTKEFGEIVDFYITETKGRLVILGAPGTGKTVLTVLLTVGLLKRRQNGEPVPFLVSLPSWDPANQDFVEWLAEQIAIRFRIGRKIAARMVQDELILPVLDGLDEMDSSETAPHRSEQAVKGINDYIACTPDARIVVVCRSGPRYYERLSRTVRNADEITIQNLEPKKIIGYVRTHCPDERALDAWEPVFNALMERKPNPVLSALDTPWRLTAAVTLYLQGEDPRQLLPTDEELSGSGDYAARIKGLLMETYVIAKVLLHRKRLNAAVTSIRQLRHIASRLAVLEATGHGGKEIVLSQWWNAFASQSVVVFHVGLTFLVLQIPSLVIGYGPSAEQGILSFLGVLSGKITIWYFACKRAITRDKPVAFRLRSLRSPAQVVMSALSVVVSTVCGLLAGTAYGAMYGVGIGMTSAALMLLVAASYGPQRVDATHPLASLLNDRNFAIALGLTVGAFAFLYYIPLRGITTALMLALMCVMGSILASAYTRYLVTAFVGWIYGLPLRLARFLSWAQRAGFLRLSGAGYQFRHQELLEYLQRR